MRQGFLLARLRPRLEERAVRHRYRSPARGSGSSQRVPGAGHRGRVEPPTIAGWDQGATLVRIERALPQPSQRVKRKDEVSAANSIWWSHSRFEAGAAQRARLCWIGPDPRSSTIRGRVTLIIARTPGGQ